MDDLGRSEPKTEDQTEKGAKHSKKWAWGSLLCRIQATQRLKQTTRKIYEHGNKHRPEMEKTKKLGRSVLDDLGRSGAKTEHQTHKGATHSKKWAWGSPFCRIQAPQRPRRTNGKRNEHGNKHKPEIEKTRAGEVRFGRFGPLRGQKRHQTEKGATSQKMSLESPFRIVSQDSGTSAAEADHQKDIRTRKQAQAGDGENMSRLNSWGRSVLEDLGRSRAKTDHQKEKGATHSKRWAWEIRFARGPAG